MSGYIRLYRSLMGHPAFANDSEAMAFAWLVAKAQWKATQQRYKGQCLKLKRGQVAISQRDMARALDRDKSWVNRLWKKTEREAMIEAEVNQGVTILTILNYDKYQHSSDRDEPADEAEVRREKFDLEPAANQGRTTEQGREIIKEENQVARESLKKVAKPEPLIEIAGEETIMRAVREDLRNRLPAGQYALFADPARPITFIAEEGRLVACCPDAVSHMTVRDLEYRLSQVAQEHGFSAAWIRERQA